MPSMKCKNCGRPIALPLTKLYGKSPAQRLWPTDGKPRNFLCPQCKHVSEYTVESPRLDDDTQAQEAADKNWCVFRISIECGQGSPAHCAQILVIAPGTQLLPDEASSLLYESQSADGVKCDMGHVLTWAKGQHRGTLGWPILDPDWNAFYQPAS